MDTMRPGRGYLSMDKVGDKYWDPVWVFLPSVFCSGPNSAGRPGDWMEDSGVRPKPVTREFLPIEDPFS